jgi:hypothetical protein
LRRQLEGVAGTLHLFAVVSAMQHLVFAERPGHAHIGFVTEYVGGPGQFGLDRWHHQFSGARAQTDDRQTTARTADLRSVQRLSGHRDGNAGIR